MSNQSLREAEQQAAPTFEQFCKKYGLDPDQMNGGGGMWARVAIEDWQRATALAQPDDKAQPVAWHPLETAPEGVRVLLGPRNAPVVGVVKHMPDWADEQDSIAHVVHYNGKTLVSNYRCSEWMPLPDSDPQPPAEQSVAFQYRAEQVQKDMKPVYEAFKVEGEQEPKRPENYGTNHCSCIECPYEHGAELSDELLCKEARLALGHVLAERYRNDLLKLMRRVIAADRAAHGGDK